MVGTGGYDDGSRPLCLLVALVEGCDTVSRVLRLLIDDVRDVQRGSRF